MNLYFGCTFESSAIDFFLFSVYSHWSSLCKRSGTQIGHVRLDAWATTEHFSLKMGLYGGIVSRHWSVVSCVRGVSVGAGLGFPVGVCATLRFPPPTSDHITDDDRRSQTMTDDHGQWQTLTDNHRWLIHWLVWVCLSVSDWLTWLID